VVARNRHRLFIMDLQHGILLFFIGCSATFIGFFIAFLIINYNMKKSKKKKIKGPMDDLMKYMPGWKGDDCQ
jgi:uncharacterized membrane protein YgaE (UPF0421/DUF939 family)